MKIEELRTIVVHAQEVAWHSVLGGYGATDADRDAHKEEAAHITAALIQAAATNDEWKNTLLNPKKE